MDASDLYVLENALIWLESGQPVALVTVVETWGSSPRPVGSLLAVAEDGRFVGSVSGGCIEEHLVARIDREFPERPQTTSYGVTADEARRFGLPCGGTMGVAIEPLQGRQAIEDLRWCVGEIRSRRRVSRTLDMATGQVRVATAGAREVFAYDGQVLHTVHGPSWRLVIVGAGHLARYLAQMAVMLDFNVHVTDPRLEYRAQWDVPQAELLDGMPDDAVLALGIDPFTALITTAHDPKVDDMALLEALKSEAFYIGALGSTRTSAKRRIRLGLFDLTAEQIGRLRAPAGLSIGSHTPAEIALSMLAEIVAVRNQLMADTSSAQQAAVAREQNAAACLN